MLLTPLPMVKHSRQNHALARPLYSRSSVQMLVSGRRVASVEPVLFDRATHTILEWSQEAKLSTVPCLNGELNSINDKTDSEERYMRKLFIY